MSSEPLMGSASAVSKRPVLNTQDPNAIRIVYRAKLDERMKTCLLIQGIMNPCSGFCCRRDDLYDSSYVHIHENRVEVNYPSPFQCCLCMGPCSQINDYVQVYYFDKRLTDEATRSECCVPICLPLGLNPLFGGYVPPMVVGPILCCPTWFDMCGQGATLHGKMPFLCCHNFAQIHFLEDANAFVQAFNDAKQQYAAAGSAPVQQTMV